MEAFQRAEEQAAVVRTLQKDLDELRDVRQREKERESRRAAEDEDELQILRNRLEKLEEDKQNWQTGVRTSSRLGYHGLIRVC
jgi:FtsZ-binding cell division protein ZapB